MNAQLAESLYDLWEIGGSELAKQGAGGIKRQLLLDLEMSGLDADRHDVIRFHAVNRWDEDDEFLEYACPREPLCAEAERITGITNDQLAHCRSSDAVMADFRAFIDGAELIGNDFSINFLSRFLRG